ncbi:MAG: ribose-phosphate pyrophosphokinase [Waddliaceae bacterium]|nr:ribose-phosphate pyrophosphokinase [Waddliaceae bacterium]
MEWNQQTPILFSGTSHPDLSLQIASQLNVSLGKVHLEQFPDGEISCQILENVRGRSVFVVQSIAQTLDGSPNDHLMELLILVDALKRASARRIVAIIPYFGYSRQDRKDKPRVPITARLVANLLETAGVDRVLTMDLHADQLQGFFDIPLDNLYARPVLSLALQKWGIEDDVVVVAPDIGGIRLARAFANHFGGHIAIVDKKRTGAETVEVSTVIGDVKDKTVLLTDDICSTAGTLAAAANVCTQFGAKRVIAAITHGLLVGKALEKISNSSIEFILLSDSVPREPGFHHEKIRIISAAGLFAEAVRCILQDTSISSLFDLENWREKEKKQLSNH